MDAETLTELLLRKMETMTADERERVLFALWGRFGDVPTFQDDWRDLCGCDGDA